MSWGGFNEQPDKDDLLFLMIPFSVPIIITVILLLSYFGCV